MIWEVLQEINDITNGKTGIKKITVHDNNSHGHVHCFINFDEHGKAAFVRKHLRNLNKMFFYNAYFDWKKRCCIYNQLPQVSINVEKFYKTLSENSLSIYLISFENLLFF